MNLRLGARLFELQVGGERLLPMEGLRGLSALLVFFVHFWALFGSRSPGPPVRDIFRLLGTLGHCGVDVFFALSGFLIYGSLLAKPVPYMRFVRHRIGRLYPVFITVFLLYAGIGVALPMYSRIPSSLSLAVPYLVANLLMLPGIVPIVPMITVAWSLSYELCFYLTIPLLFRFSNMRRWPRLARIVFIAILCVGGVALSQAGLWEHQRMIMFGCGMLLREIIHVRVSWARAGNYGATALFVLALIFVGVRGERTLTQGSGPIVVNSVVGVSLLFVSTLAFGYFGLGDQGWVAKWLSWDVLRWFGNISYSYYLIHGMVLNMFKAVADGAGLSASLSSPGFVALCLLCFAGTVVGSAIMFLAIEKRFSFRAPSAESPRGAVAVDLGSSITP